MIRHSRADNLQRRSGFTLTELMIVILIISMLLAISVPVIGMAMTNARAAATRATLTKINGLIQERRQAFDRTELPKARINAVLTTSPFSNATYGVKGDKDLARIIARKVAYRALLPQFEDDLYGLDATVGTSDDAPLMAKVTTLKGMSSFSNDADGELESVELLYLALTEGSVLGNPVGDEEFRTSEVRDTDGDGLLEFIDGWGTPLRFCRWPTRLIRPAEVGSEDVPQFSSSGSYPHKIRPDFGHNSNATSVGATANILISGLQNPPAGYTRGSSTTIADELKDPLAIDPDDPYGLFAAWINRNSDGTFSQFSEKGWQTQATFHTPLLISSGPDKATGLLAESNFDDYGHLAQPDWNSIQSLIDNITNAQQFGSD